MPAKKTYTMREMKDIVKYLVENRAYDSTRGRAMWVAFAESEKTHRTWQSLKEVFLKRILHDIHNPYYELTPDQIKSFRVEKDVCKYSDGSNLRTNPTRQANLNSHAPQLRVLVTPESERSVKEPQTSSEKENRTKKQINDFITYTQPLPDSAVLSDTESTPEPVEIEEARGSRVFARKRTETIESESTSNEQPAKINNASSGESGEQQRKRQLFNGNREFQAEELNESDVVPKRKMLARNDEKTKALADMFGFRGGNMAGRNKPKREVRKTSKLPARKRQRHDSSNSEPEFVENPKKCDPMVLPRSTDGALMAVYNGRIYPLVTDAESDSEGASRRPRKSRHRTGPIVKASSPAFDTEIVDLTVKDEVLPSAQFNGESSEDIWKRKYLEEKKKNSKLARVVNELLKADLISSPLPPTVIAKQLTEPPILNVEPQKDVVEPLVISKDTDEAVKKAKSTRKDNVEPKNVGQEPAGEILEPSIEAPKEMRATRGRKRQSVSPKDVSNVESPKEHTKGKKTRSVSAEKSSSQSLKVTINSGDQVVEVEGWGENLTTVLSQLLKNMSNKPLNQSTSGSEETSPPSRKATSKKGAKTTKKTDTLSDKEEQGTSKPARASKRKRSNDIIRIRGSESPPSSTIHKRVSRIEEEIFQKIDKMDQTHSPHTHNPAALEDMEEQMRPASMELQLVLSDSDDDIKIPPPRTEIVVPKANKKTTDKTKKETSKPLKQPKVKTPKKVQKFKTKLAYISPTSSQQSNKNPKLAKKRARKADSIDDALFKLPINPVELDKANTSTNIAVGEEDIFENNSDSTYYDDSEPEITSTRKRMGKQRFKRMTLRLMRRQSLRSLRKQCHCDCNKRNSGCYPLSHRDLNLTSNLPSARNTEAHPSEFMSHMDQSCDLDNLDISNITHHPKIRSSYSSPEIPEQERLTFVNSGKTYEMIEVTGRTDVHMSCDTSKDVINVPVEKPTHLSKQEVNRIIGVDSEYKFDHNGINKSENSHIATITETFQSDFANLQLQSPAIKITKPNDDNAGHNKQKSTSPPLKTRSIAKGRQSLEVLHEESMMEYTCSCKAVRKSCPPAIVPKEKSLNSTQKVKKTKKPKKIIKVKIRRPTKKRDSRKVNADVAASDSGINQTLHSCIDTMIHNHSDTCADAGDCDGSASKREIKARRRSYGGIEGLEPDVLSMGGGDMTSSTDYSLQTTQEILQQCETSPLGIYLDEKDLCEIGAWDLITEDESSDRARETQSPLSNDRQIRRTSKELKGPSMTEREIRQKYGEHLTNIFPVSVLVPDLSDINEDSQEK